MIYYVEIYCRDCTGADPDGCFDGGSEILSEKERPWPAIKFESVEAAKDAGWDRVSDCGPWEFHVKDEQNNIVYSSYIDLV